MEALKYFIHSCINLYQVRRKVLSQDQDQDQDQDCVRSTRIFCEQGAAAVSSSSSVLTEQEVFVVEWRRMKFIFKETRTGLTGQVQT